MSKDNCCAENLVWFWLFYTALQPAITVVSLMSPAGEGIGVRLVITIFYRENTSTSKRQKTDIINPV
jgi:hypothetical protein